MRTDAESGAAREAQSTALLLTGLQNDFCDPQGGLAASARDHARIVDMLPAARRLLELARAAGITIVHLRETSLQDGLSDSQAWVEQAVRSGRPSGLCLSGTWGEEFAAELAPAEGELVVERFRPGGLSDSRADLLLRSSGARRLVVAGVETHRSVLATVVQAVNLDYEVIVPVDCVASGDGELDAAAAAVLEAWAETMTLDRLAPRLQGAAPVAGGR